MNPLHFEMLERDKLVEGAEIYIGHLANLFLWTRKIELANL